MKKIVIILLVLYYVGINSYACYLMRVDKQIAVDNANLEPEDEEMRISEKKFFTLAITGAPVGIEIGMYVFRHKVSKASWRVGMPSLIINHIVFFIIFYRILYRKKKTK